MTLLCIIAGSPHPPKDVSVTSLSPTAARVSWLLQPNTSSDSFIITCNSSTHTTLSLSGTLQSVRDQQSDVHTATVGGLDPDTLYTCCVVVRNEGVGSSSEKCVAGISSVNLQVTSTPAGTMVSLSNVPVDQLSSTLPLITGSTLPVVTGSTLPVVISTLPVVTSTLPLTSSNLPLTNSTLPVVTSTMVAGGLNVEAVQAGSPAVGWAVGILIGVILGAVLTMVVLIVIVVILKRKNFIVKQRDEW